MAVVRIEGPGAGAGHRPGPGRMLTGVRIRLELDELTVDVLTDAPDLDHVRAGLQRAISSHQISTHRTPGGGQVLINWRAVGRAAVALAPDRDTRQESW